MKSINAHNNFRYRFKSNQQIHMHLKVIKITFYRNEFKKKTKLRKKNKNKFRNK